MKEINNLIYTLEINYESKPGLKTSISIQFHEDGLEVKSIKVGDVCITEETINGRVLSGRYENTDGYCGYRFDYQNGENLLNINPNVSISATTSLINNTKMTSEFLSAKMVASSILRNDYRVLILNKGNLSIIKTISAEDENAEHCSIQENIDLSKFSGEESFDIQNKKVVYNLGNMCFTEDSQTLKDDDVKLKLSELIDIFHQNPKNHKELIKFKNEIQKRTINSPSDEEISLQINEGL